MRERIKNPNRKEEVQLFCTVDDMILHLKIPEDTILLTELLNAFSKAGGQNNQQINQYLSYIQILNMLRKIIRNNTSFE
jgi:hypothetical protein